MGLSNGSENRVKPVIFYKNYQPINLPRKEQL